MNVGLMVVGSWYEIGSSDLLHSFFSTISYILENDGWGSKYPILLKKFYNGMILPEDTSLALEEVKDARLCMSQFHSSDIIWDIEDLSKKVPEWYKDNLKSDDLSNCFISVNGRNIFDIFFEVLEFSSRRKFKVEIGPIEQFIGR